jgi:hypothetical protein
MSDYTFSVLDVFVEPYAVAPQLTARVRVEEATGQPVHAIALRCQLRIQPQRRPYGPGEQGGLVGIFGDRERWVDTLRPLLWMQCNTTVQGFTGSTELDLPLPCTYDFDVVGSRYLHALDAGAVPLTFLFSGTVFTRGVAGFGVQQVPWDCEADHDMPVAVWRQLIDAHYPGTGWIRMDRDALALLERFRAERGLTSWEETVHQLLADRQQAVP